MSRRESTRVDRTLVANVGAAVFLLVILAGVVILWAGVLDEPLPPCTSTSTSVCIGDPSEHTTDGTEKETP